VPPMLAALVQTGVLSLDGKTFSGLDACRSCGSGLAGYDTKARRFAMVRDEDGRTREVTVWVKRFACRECGRISPARAPFYPGTRYGSPVVDLCVVLSRRETPGKAAALMEELGLVIDRATVRTYAARDFGTIPVTEIYGLALPSSIISLTVLGTRFV